MKVPKRGLALHRYGNPMITYPFLPQPKDGACSDRDAMCKCRLWNLSVEWGRLPIRIFEFELPEGRRVQSVVASVGGEMVSTTASFSDDKVTLTMEEEVVLTAGDKMAVEVSVNL